MGARFESRSTEASPSLCRLLVLRGCLLVSFLVEGLALVGLLLWGFVGCLFVASRNIDCWGWLLFWSLFCLSLLLSLVVADGVVAGGAVAGGVVAGGSGGVSWVGCLTVLLKLLVGSMYLLFTSRFASG